MAYETKPGCGNIFKNDGATGNQPAFKGKCKLEDGTAFDIALWIATDQEGNPKLVNGNKFFNAKVSPPWVKPGSEEAPPVAAPQADSADGIF